MSHSFRHPQGYNIQLRAMQLHHFMCEAFHRQACASMCDVMGGGYQ